MTRRVHYSTFRAVAVGRVYYCICRVTVGRSAPRVGPDSPHYLDPGLPSRLEILRVLRDRVEVTPDADLRESLLAQCCQAAGHPPRLHASPCRTALTSLGRADAPAPVPAFFDVENAR